MHDRVYMFFKAYHYVFLYKATILHFCLLSVALIFYTLNKHSNTSDNLSLDDMTIISYKQV